MDALFLITCHMSRHGELIGGCLYQMRNEGGEGDVAVDSSFLGRTELHAYHLVGMRCEILSCKLNAVSLVR